VRRLAGNTPLGNGITRLPVRATFDVSTAINKYTSSNIIGRLRGTGRSGEAVLVLGHWDHLGICRPEGAPDRICNGAVDNASGIAMMIETARHLARGKRPVRDILFMGTTAEESGLLGAAHYAASKPAGVVGAVNIDMVAITPRGAPVSIVGRGTTRLDPLVDATARELGRAVDTDLEANAFLQRQDGWELTKAGIPTVMVGGAFSSMATLGTFLSAGYHKPEDDLSRPIELGGAAEDAELTIALVRKLADPAIYRPAAR
jgi:Zn-dependent M28 family amino/carboxypeptidase